MIKFDVISHIFHVHLFKLLTTQGKISEKFLKIYTIGDLLSLGFRISVSMISVSTLLTVMQFDCYLGIMHWEVYQLFLEVLRLLVVLLKHLGCDSLHCLFPATPQSYATSYH